MKFKSYFREVDRINKLPTLEERRKAQKELDIKSFEEAEKRLLRTPLKVTLWQIVNNTANLIVFFVILPFQPIIYIIKAIRGELS